MNIYVATAALVGLLMFLRLSVTWKVLAAFIVMSQGFDLLPHIVYGTLVWDVGAIMLLIAATQLMFSRPQEPRMHAFSATILQVFVLWLVFSLAYSLLIYQYPVMNTLKTSRHMIIGYLSIFIFLRLFRIHQNALPTFIKWLYPITYILLVLAIVQSLAGIQILQGLVIEYEGAVRYLPVFLPISLFYLWVMLSKYFQGGSIKFHEMVYGMLVLVVVATTYTRGIYIAVFASFLIQLSLLLRRGRLKATSAIFFVVLTSTGLAVIVGGGWADRVIGRAASGIDVFLDKHDAHTKDDVDTFSGRLLLVKERIALVAERNPIIGFGFLHESDVPASLRREFKYGSVIYSPDMVEKYAHGHPYVLALYSADIGWANIVVNTGFVGFFLFFLFVAAFLLGYKKMKNERAPFSHYRTAFFVQTITLLILMFNGNTFTNNVQIPALMIAGYLYCSAKRRMEVPRPSSISNLAKDNPEPGYLSLCNGNSNL